MRRLDNGVMGEIKCPHCDTSVDEHEAGRCLDAWVAEAVMGSAKPKHFAHTPAHVWDVVWEGEWFCELIYGEGDKCKWTPRHYSTDIAAAWEVVGRFPNWVIDISRGKYVAYVEPEGHGKGEGHSNSAPLAICRAALKAVGE